MNTNYSNDELEPDDDGQERSSSPTHGESNGFKKLKRPMHVAKRSKIPERLRGMHRRRRKRMNW
jgi:hypothetical protein